jgi:hypothetical protein
MPTDTSLFRQGRDDRGTGAVLGPGAFPPRSAVGETGAG